MSETKNLVQKITEGIQEKKGKNIVIADLTSIEDTICKYFVICQGNSPNQVSAIVDSITKCPMGGYGLFRCSSAYILARNQRFL